MKKLLDYLRSLDRVARSAFCQRCETSENYLRKACSTGQRLGADLCVSIERESAGAVTRRDLRLDDWQRFWPELVNEDRPVPLVDAPAVREAADA